MKQDGTRVPQEFMAEIDRGRKRCCCLCGALPAQQVANHLQIGNQTHSKTVLAANLNARDPYPRLLPKSCSNAIASEAGLCRVGCLPKLFRHHGQSSPPQGEPSVRGCQFWPP